GGVSSLKNPALADELGAARARAVIGSGAEVVVSQCPGCVTQLSNHLSRMGTPVRACHAMELIGM
ncbi:MAG: (Fe-S)-binding protein, partial [Mailhella sp.]|nr:(Fe-S)-binding protein [Mailhella sp.]